MDFDNGGPGVAYYDTTAGNAGGAYRSTDVDIAASSDGGYCVGWIAAGEWLNYTVNVTSGGNYTAHLRVASPNGGGQLHIGFTGSGVWTTVSIPATGDWQWWTTVDVPVSLSAGTQVMTLLFDTNGFNVGAITVDKASSSGGSGGSLRMMTWNVQSGYDLNENYNPWQQIQIMADQHPDVICLEEVNTWDADEPTLYRTYLEQLTGQTWYAVYAPDTPDSGTIGNLLLTRFPIQAQNTTIFQADPGNPSDNLGNRDAARVLINVNGVWVNIIVTHLDYDSTGYRTTQLGMFMPWAESFGGPQLVAGDFNSWWGEYWITTMETAYSDTWLDVTGSNGDGYTIGNVRFDYIFRLFDGSSHLTPTNVWVVDTSASDHRPVVADFSVR